MVLINSAKKVVLCAFQLLLSSSLVVSLGGILLSDPFCFFKCISEDDFNSSCKGWFAVLDL